MDDLDLFSAALELRTPEERAKYLVEACGGNEALRKRIGALLKSSEKVSEFLETPAVAIENAPTLEASIPERPGLQVGPYKLLERIGEGGMGEVWMAQQTERVRRKVAVKLIKTGMDSKQVVARFEAERQALALMDHPNIAKVLDAGTTDSGLPYFVMELVKGVSITSYCDEHKLTPRERLALFLPVCHAIQHAHQKGVIHRDLKPSNVLVALYDGQPVPKVIDFGVAKAVGVELTDKTLFTGFGSVIGTLEYMSPEQAELNNLDIDTRSDVYSLGAMLYELLTGTTPLESKRLKSTSLLEMLRLIREEEPLAPSTRLSTAKELAALAASRGVEENRLSGLVRGEVDWIVMKCLEKRRSHRYETASGLARDLERYLADEPVLACPPSTGYRLRKFARRNRVALAMIGVVLSGLLLAIVGLSASTLLIWKSKGELERALANEQRSSYWQRIALADRELASNNLLACETLLERCPREYRGWEWHYLRRASGKSPPPLRHDHALYRLAVSPNGKFAVCPDSGGFITVWDVATATRLQRFRAYEMFVDRIAFHPDGSYFVTSNYDPSERVKCEIKVWNAQTFELVTSWTGPTSGLGSMAFGPDGLLACGFVTEGQDGMTELREPLSGEVVKQLGKAKLGTMGLAYSQDGRLLAEVTNGSEANLWDVGSGRSVRSFTFLRQPNAMALSPDGRLLAIGFGQEGEKGSDQVLIWETDTGHRRPPLVGQQIRSIRFSPDGSRLATGGMDQAIKIWDLPSGQEVLTLRGHQDWVEDLAFTPDGHRLLSAGNDGVARIWDGRPLGEDEVIGEELFTLRGHASGVRSVVFHPNQPLIATAGHDGRVILWDRHTGRQIRQLTTALVNVEAMVFAPDGQSVVVGGRPGDFVQMLDCVSGQEVNRLTTTSDVVLSLAYRPDGRHLAIAGKNGTVYVRTPSTGRLVAEMPVHRWPIYQLDYCQDPKTPLLASTDTMAYTVRLWDANTYEVLPGAKLQHSGTVYGAAFNAGGTRLASVGWDRVVRLWDTKSWKQVDAQRDFTGAPQGVAFSPDEQLVAWVSTDSTVKVWHLASGEVATLRGHTDVVYRAAFSPDGQQIASASQDGTTKVWKTPLFSDGYGPFQGASL